MNEVCIVSIIIPIYNAEKYILRCLKSIVLQTYKRFEVVLIDDGSVDGTSKICKKFVDQYKNKFNIKYFYKENGGPAIARNFGIDKACGKFITFIDSDDYIDRDHIENFINFASSYDLVMQGLRMINNNDRTLSSIYNVNNAIIANSRDEINKKFNECVAFGWVNNKLYRTDIIKNNRLKFKSLERSEDRIFNIEYTKYIKNFIMLQTCTYNYMLIENSITHLPIHPYSYVKSAHAHEKLEKSKDICKNIRKYSGLYALICYRDALKECNRAMNNFSKKIIFIYYITIIFNIFASNLLIKYPIVAMTLFLGSRGRKLVFSITGKKLDGIFPM